MKKFCSKKKTTKAIRRFLRKKIQMSKKQLMRICFSVKPKPNRKRKCLQLIVKKNDIQNSNESELLSNINIDDDSYQKRKNSRSYNNNNDSS